MRTVQGKSDGYLTATKSSDEPSSTSVSEVMSSCRGRVAKPTPSPLTGGSLSASIRVSQAHDAASSQKVALAASATSTSTPASKVVAASGEVAISSICATQSLLSSDSSISIILSLS